MDQLKFLDAQTKRKGRIRFTGFSNSVADTVRAFQGWVRDNELTQKDIWYANIFECGSDKHLAYCVIENSDYEISIHFVDDSKINPYRRSIKQLLQFLLP